MDSSSRDHAQSAGDGQGNPTLAASDAPPPARYMLLGALIARRRADLKLSLQDVGDAAECSKAHVWELEQGRTQNPSIATIMGLSRALQLTPNDVFAAAVRSWGMT